MVNVIKMNGEVDKYDPEKVKRSCLRAGVSAETAEKVIDEVSKKIYDGIPTGKLFKIVHNLLANEEEHLAARYNLKEAVSNMDSDCFEFEYYITRLLSRCGYDARHSPEPKIQGRCSDHEIDVVVKKDKELALVECKHHFRSHTYTGLDVPMRQWSRLDDVQNADKNNDKGTVPATLAWVITNTKYSEHAITYARCKGIKMTGWNFPHSQGLNDLIEVHKAYPLSMISMPKWARQKLIDEKIYDVLDLKNASTEALKRTGLKEEDINAYLKLVDNLLKMR